MNKLTNFLLDYTPVDNITQSAHVDIYYEMPEIYDMMLRRMGIALFSELSISSTIQRLRYNI